MDSFKNAVGLGEGQGNGNSEDNQQKSSGGGFGGIGDKLNEAAGGGKAGEAKEDYLDKGRRVVTPAAVLKLTSCAKVSMQLSNMDLEKASRTTNRQ